MDAFATFLSDYGLYLVFAFVAYELITLLPWRSWFGRGAAPRKAGAAQRRRARGQARIVSIQRTGLSINDVPQIELALHLDLPDRTYDFTIRELVDPLAYGSIQPGNTLAVAYDPDDLDNLVTELDPERYAESAETPERPTISVTAGEIDAPLWTYGHDGAERWLVPPRAARTPVSVITFSDPHDTERRAMDGVVVEMASHLVAEALWMTTDVPAASAILIATAERKLHVPTGPIKAYEELEGYLSSVVTRPIAIWGAARRDVLGDGFVLRLRTPGAGTDVTFTMPLPQLADAGISYLAGAGQCAPINAPGWYSPVPPALVSLYATQLHHLELLVLGSPRNNILAITDELYEGFCDLANDIAEHHGHVLLAFTALTTCQLAARAGKLSSRQRDRALAILSRYDGGHPIHKLSPSYLNAFGLTDLAHRRRAELAGLFADPYRTSADPYQEWLARLPLGASSPPVTGSLRSAR